MQSRKGCLSIVVLLAGVLLLTLGGGALASPPIVELKSERDVYFEEDTVKIGLEISHLGNGNDAALFLKFEAADNRYQSLWNRYISIDGVHEHPKAIIPLVLPLRWYQGMNCTVYPNEPCFLKFPARDFGVGSYRLSTLLMEQPVYEHTSQFDTHSNRKELLFHISPTTVMITTNAGAGGSINPTIRTVPIGQTTTFTVTPDAGFGIADVTGCDGSLSGNTYTTGPITGACTVSATFSQDTYTVTAVAGEGGTIEPGSQTVSHGQTTDFIVTPNAGHGIASVTGCGGSLTGNTYTTGPITGACTVSATFSQDTYTVTAVAGQGGAIGPGSRTVSHGQTTDFFVMPNDNCIISEVTGCGGSLTGSTYTTGPITGACTVSATFLCDDEPEPM